MATLTSGTGALDVYVTDASSLTNPNALLVHPLIGGGLPKVTRRASAGLSGTLELLCSDGATADAVYAAHLDGAVLHLDEAIRTNLVLDPRLTTGTMTTNGATVVDSRPSSGAQDGGSFFRRVMTTANTASPMTLALGPTGTGAIPVTVGTPVVTLWDARKSPPGGPASRVDVGWYTAAGVALSASNGSSQTLSDTWQRFSQTHTPPATAAFGQPRLIWTGIALVGQTLDLARVQVGDVGAYFDGSTAGGELVNRWSGPANNSVSKQFGHRPALDFWYIAAGVEIPRKVSMSKYLVRVSGVQEVAP